MSYFIEHWIRAGEADAFRQEFAEQGHKYYPHITLVRPFSLKTSGDEIKQLIVGACRGKSPIPFNLEGMGSFGDIKYIPVVSQELLEFADWLEELLAPKVEFVEKLDEYKTLHLTISTSEQRDPFPSTSSHMLRLTVIRDKKIWFSYDFVTGEVLDRESTLDRDRWEKTVKQFHDTNPGV
ncbi:MAG: 2'-5' RNA ligase family protein [bacterium]|nr:2'-5' RNA ligase family protein [bacterium]